MNTLPTLMLALLACALVGCPADSDADDETNATTEETSSTGGVPASLFTDTAPENAVTLVDAKTDAKPGDRVVFEARVGGRRDPFLEDRAVFFVADASLLSCDQMPGDTCPTPWDYCCEPPANLLRNMATVQVVDDEGRPLEVSLEDTHGLAPLGVIVVVGTVDQVDDSGVFVVNAETIHVKGG